MDYFETPQGKRFLRSEEKKQERAELELRRAAESVMSYWKISQAKNHA